jgi:predicted transcriptional regulator
MTEQQSNIPDAERDVLACLVQLEQATVKELRDALAKVRPMQPSSVLTLLNRLEARKLVTKRKAEHGKALIFRPTKASARAWSGLVKNLFQQAFGGDTMAFMTSFFETRKPTASEIDQLQKLLDELKSAGPKQGEKPDAPSE